MNHPPVGHILRYKQKGNDIMAADYTNIYHTMEGLKEGLVWISEHLERNCTIEIELYAQFSGLGAIQEKK